MATIGGAAPESKAADSQSGAAAPQLGLPKAGASIRGIGEKFSANPVTGTGALSVPIALSPGRGGFSPNLSLQYDSGSGNEAFGLGWTLSLPSITRRTDKGLPKYDDAIESDIFVLSDAEDLVPVLVETATDDWIELTIPPRDGYAIKQYRPRIEGLFARIERWTRQSDGDTYWRSISRDNVISIYGATSCSRVADPQDPTKVFSWLISSSTDDKGNAVLYKYAEEDSKNIDVTQPCEINRTPTLRGANRYIKRILYGNVNSALGVTDLDSLEWLFEVVFDYDEGHCQEQPPDAEGRVFATASITASRPWSARPDPFSRYRSSFEVRTYRLCKRILLFHHFASELGVADYLVRTIELSYLLSPVASTLASVTQSGFVRQDNSLFLRSSLPTLEFEYSEAKVQQAIEEVNAESLENLPSNVDGRRYRWLDLDGEGLQCVLAEQSGAWFYKRNLSPLSLMVDWVQSGASVRFESLSEVSRIPAWAEAQSSNSALLDLTGDGHRDYALLDRPGSGFYERTRKPSWEPFQPLRESPNVDWGDPNLRLIDVDGDGFSDILITEHDAFTYFPSLHWAGFGSPIRVPKATDEEKGPAVIFADSTQSIFLADMSGDGLSDIVRIRNGEVCYWPNTGYGSFGSKVSMGQAPWFDTPDLFDQRRLRLADVDGSGPTDIIYLASEGVKIHFNQSGNAWSAPQRVADFPPADSLSAIQVVDLLSNGTACLVWTTSLPGDVGHLMRYIDLMGGVKPYLLVRSANNLGAETRVSYAPSTAFYLADRKAGRPWATSLPFPVQVVERVETYDWVSRNRFVSRYAYHHGYFDGVEREFRGFGMVEQRDTEELGVLTQSGAFPATNDDAASYVPPVLTKTWFHTGAYPMGPRVTRIYDHEYWKEPALSPDQAAAMLLPDSTLQATTLLPGSPIEPDLTGDEIREALRSLKGAMLRQEIYAFDGTPAQSRPYSVSERNYTANRLQPFGRNRHAVFLTHARESLELHYERATYQVSGDTVCDPRTTHSFVLEVDEYGNEKKSVAIGYGRKYPDPDPLLTPADQAIQGVTLVTYTESTYTNPIFDDDQYRTRLPADIRTYELTGYTPTGTGNRFQSSDFVQSTSAGLTLIFDSEIPYEGTPTTGRQRRLIEQARTLYRKDDLTTALPLGALDTMALPYVSYKLALTPGLLSLYQRGAENLLPAPASVLKDQAGYVLGDDQAAAGLFPASDPTGVWWVPSGQVFYSPSPSDTPAQELATAQAHFFLPRRYRDAFGANTPSVNDTIVTFDPYDLLPVTVQDAAKNTVSSVNDYRVLQPKLLTDPNNNQSAVAFDALGLVVGTAVMGKAGELLGDSLDGFAVDLTQAQIDAFFAAPKGPTASALLGNATARSVYDLGRFASPPSTDASPLPVFVATVARETHVAALGAGQVSNLQVSFSYSDGFGRAIQRKAQAEPGPLATGGPTVDPRWVGSGWIIYNNKGKPVRQYEPFFDDTHDFKFGAAVGMSPTLFYDPVGRVVATLHPDQSWEKVVFDPWRQDSWDRNDTVLTDPSSDPDVAAYFLRLPAADYRPTWYQQRTSPGADPEAKDAAQKAAVHASTPITVQADSLGRAFLSFAYNRSQLGLSPPVEGHYRTLTTFDIEGKQRSVTDALGRAVMTYDYDMLGTRIHQLSVDAGERWMLNNVLGKPLLGWDSRAHQITHEYDALRRPTNLWVQTGAGAKQLAEQSVYGEGQTNDQGNNLRGKLYQQFDGAGVVANSAYDVKGNLLTSSRELLVDYRDQVDWSLSPALTGKSFAASSTFDALNRPVTTTAPDGSVANLTYNEASLLAQVSVNIRGAAAATPFVSAISYNPKGQRELIAYGNGAQTAYKYDRATFRLTTLKTIKMDGAILQALAYAYDPVGNITHIADGAQQTIFFKNQIVEPSNDYVYDAVYRLIQAQGRESIGLAAQPQTTWSDGARMTQPLPLPADAQALRTYTETYTYDSVGNFSSLAHSAAGGNWTRTYAYDEPNSPPTNNRLTSTKVGGANETPYSYDAHGNMVAMPHLSLMAWDFKDQLQATQQRVSDGPVETTYYVYDAAGQRVRKVTDTASGTKANERIYLGGYEVYREYGASGGAQTLERDTLHVMDDKRRIALVETQTIDPSAPGNSTPTPTIRYQFDNHLGSACLELNETASIITYEEYYPYGSTSYQGGPNAAEVSLKRYRFTGKERDEENGFGYHGARYYAPWVGRWTACDPVGSGQSSVYVYCGCDPIGYTDKTGFDEDEANGVSFYNPSSSLDEQNKSSAYAAPKAETAGFCAGYCPAPAQPKPEQLSSSAKMPPPTPRPPPVPDIAVAPATAEDVQGAQAFNRAQAEISRIEKNPNQYDIQVTLESKRVGGVVDPSGTGGILKPLVQAVYIAAGYDPLASAAAASKVEATGGALLHVVAALSEPLENAGGATAGAIDEANFQKLSDLTGHTGPDSRVYQLVDELGDPWRIGETVDVRTRLNDHADLKKGFGRAFRGMEIISDPLPLPQARALEKSLGERFGVATLSREASSMYKLGGNWDPELEGISGAEGYRVPSYTLLNPAYYPWVRGLPWSP